MPNHGNELVEYDETSTVTKDGRKIPITYREFSKGKERQLIAYWTQEGRDFWTPEDDRAAFNMTFPFRWIAKRMGERPNDASDDRIVVLIGTKTWGTNAVPKQSLLTIAGDMADELYRVCPWADPGRANEK